MSQICRVGDIAVGTCWASPHQPRQYTAVWIQGSNGTYLDDQQEIRVGDIGITDCGHTIMAIGGSPNAYDEDKQIHRVGDPVIVIEGGDGISVSGSPTTYVND